VARELLDKLTSGKLQIDHWREKATAQAQVKAEIIKHLFANLPAGAYDADEIDLKEGRPVRAHLHCGPERRRTSGSLMEASQSSVPTWSDVKAKLADFDRTGLIGLVQDLYAASEYSQAFLDVRFGLGAGWSE
jgi:hypothetical protein